MTFLKYLTWRIICCPSFTLIWDEQRFLKKKKNQRQVEESSMADPERERGLGGAELQRGTPFLKTNRISLVSNKQVTRNKDQSFVIKSCLVFCYIE